MNTPAKTPLEAHLTSKPATSIPDLWTMRDLEKALRRSRSGIDKLRARDPRFPKPLKDGTNRRSRIYFVRVEVEGYIRELLDARS